MVLGLVAAALAALLSGSGSVLQSLGIRRAGMTDGSVLALAALRKQPLYVTGFFVDILGFIAAATALHRLPLFLVQSVVASSIGITALITVFMGNRLSRQGWTALAVTGTGLVLLGVSAEPGPAANLPTFWHWMFLLAVLPIAGLGVLANRTEGRWGSPLLALTAGLGFAAVAVSARSLHAPPELWRIVQDPAAWAIAVNGATAAVLFALALQRGAVTMVSAIVFATQTVVPSGIGLMVLGDAVRDGFLLTAMAGFLAAVGGAATLARYSTDLHHPQEPASADGGPEQLDSGPEQLPVRT